MKPLESCAKEPLSHSVLGSAPIIRNLFPTEISRDAPRGLVGQRDTSHSFIAIQRFNLAVRVEGDLATLLYAPDEIVRHRRGKTRSAHQNVNMFCGLRQVNGRLTRRVACA